jgi:DNA-binding response OmpR family regulator
MRLLVAEDHPSLARSIADGLREEGYAVDLTFDGEEAAHLATVNPYDAVVLDIMLPRLDGWGVLKAIRRHRPGTPVLCLTARDAVEDRAKGLDLGADDYLVKPFAWVEFLARVRAVIRRGHGQTTPVLAVGDPEVDLAHKCVTRGGTPVSFRGREFARPEADG